VRDVTFYRKRFAALGCNGVHHFGQFVFTARRDYDFGAFAPEG
jgi:hypothetical protein